MIEGHSTVRKSAQEIEIDHLLAEEFCCDSTFAEKFLNACGVHGAGFRVTSAIPEPSLGGGGWGDLLIEGVSADGKTFALRIEDKISASPAVRQSERYAIFAGQLLQNGWHRVLTVLVAPAAYMGERANSDAFVQLEAVAGMIAATDPLRLDYRRAIIHRAIAKRQSTGVQVADVELHYLWSAYLNFAHEWVARQDAGFIFPQLRASYYDGDTWIYPVRHPSLPSQVVLRHRLCPTLKRKIGQVDLIVSRAGPQEQVTFRSEAPQGWAVSLFSSGKGIQVSLPVPGMRQGESFSGAVVAEALLRMTELVQWYLASAFPAQHSRTVSAATSDQGRRE